MVDKENLETTSVVEFYSPSKIIIQASPIHGRGVFANQDIREGEVVERCPTIPLAFRSRYHSDPQIYRYLYSQPTCPCNECKNHGFIFHMILGYGMIYNHQDDANTTWKFDYHNLVADIIANRDIKSGNEIFVDYGTKYFEDREKIELDNNAKNN
jgi:SET domain-containing protein